MVNLASIVVAGYVAKQIARNPNPEFPYGFYANETLYVLFRSLVLLGILLFAVAGAADKIIQYARGGEVEAILCGPILIYSILMVTICFSLAWSYHRAWVRTDKKSEILAAERYASIIDGMMSAVAGVVLVGVQFLEGTALAGIIPIADSILVLVLCATAFGTPASLLRRSLDEITGKSCSGERLDEVQDAIREALSEDRFENFELIDFQMTKMGRSHYCIAHVLPYKEVKVDDLDAARATVVRTCQKVTGSAMAEVVFTSKTAFAEVD